MIMSSVHSFIMNIPTEVILLITMYATLALFIVYYLSKR